MQYKKHFRYLWYLTKHRWYVFLECCKVGIPFRGAIHDLSKYMPSEYFPYVERFGGGISTGRNKDGSYDPTMVNENFTMAWFHHQKYNKHHWQYWIMPKDGGELSVLDMPLKYRKEMLADWRGAGRAQGTPDTYGWYKNNRDKMILSSDTYEWIDKALGYPRCS